MMIAKWAIVLFMAIICGIYGYERFHSSSEHALAKNITDQSEHDLAESSNTPRPIATELKVDVNDCAICSIVNSMEWGNAQLQNVAEDLPGATPDQKVQRLIATLGQKKSRVFPSKPRYDPHIGIELVDLVDLTNDILNAAGQKSVTGVFLDRQKDETPVQQLRRVFEILRTSLDSGFPPLVSLRSFVASERVSPPGFEWMGKSNHCVAIVDLPKKMSDSELGFRFGYLDSYTGKLDYGYAYVESIRPFTAAKGDDANWQWVADSPFLLAVTPSLPMVTAETPWYDRSIIDLNYAIFR
jgi:hypothetical protein